MKSPLQTLTLLALGTLAACGSSSASNPASGGDAGNGDGGGDAGAVLDPNGDPPGCASPGGASTNPPALADVAGVLDTTSTQFVIFGGDTGVPACLTMAVQHKFIADSYVLDVGCGTWTKVSSSGPSARGRQAMALDPTQNRAVLFGGEFSPGGATYTLLDDVWTFDFASSAWTQVQTTGKGPSARSDATIVVDPTANQLVVFGGNTSTSGLSFVPQNDTYTLDLSSGAWTQIASSGTLPSTRLFQSMAIDPAGRVAYVFAGAGADAFTGSFDSDVWALDLSAGSWQKVATTGTGPGGRIEGALVFDTTNKSLVAFAGHDDGNTGNENDLFVLDLTASPAAWTKLQHGDTAGSPATGQCMFPPNFTTIDKQSPERRSAFAYGPRADGHGFAVFGGNSDCGNLADSWWWSPGSNRWTNVQASPVGLSCLRVQTTCTGLCG